MKAVILCGGLGTRFSEETKHKPKPMILVGKFPILFHILKIYEKNGVDDFILALGKSAMVISMSGFFIVSKNSMFFSSSFRRLEFFKF